MKGTAEIITDDDGRRLVRINDIRFKGKRSGNWGDVKKYLTEHHIGEMYTITSSADVVYIGKDLPDEYAGSEYTYTLKGTVAKAKANAAQGLGEMLEIATDRRFTPNQKDKHNMDAANGWYRYESRFSLPIYEEDGSVERYNIFRAYMIVRHDLNGKK